jgi:hypothetical protein
VFHILKKKEGTYPVHNPIHNEFIDLRKAMQPKKQFQYTPKPTSTSTTNCSRPTNNTNGVDTKPKKLGPLFTVGYGGLTSASVLASALQQHRVNLLVDVRISPSCGYCKEFDGGMAM